MLLLRLALRNLRRNPRRTLLTAATVAFGLGVSVWLEGVLVARTRDMVSTVTGTHTGHVQVLTERYATQHAVDALLDEVPRELLQRLPAGSKVSPRAVLPVLLTHGERTSFAQLFGVDPAREREVTDLAQKVTAGSYDVLGEAHGAAVVLGAELGNALGLEVGDTVELLTQMPGQGVARRELTVGGIFAVGGGAFERSTAFAPLTFVQGLLPSPGFHEIAIRLADVRLADEVRAELARALPTGTVATTWREALPELATLVTFNDATALFFSRLVLVIVLFAAANTMWMSVQERTFEFGVMASIGTAAPQVVGLVMLEALLLAVLSAAVGLALGALVIWHHQRTGFDLRPFLGRQSNAGSFALDLVVHPLFSVGGALRSTLSIVVVVVLASALPAAFASHLRPVTALRRA
ncbi:MAG: ABC transporter permease [Planctomycetes bacterium]|nr:ABC transporter permease [Planctomycetota bacterium]